MDMNMKSAEEIKKMRHAGQMLHKVHEEVQKFVKIGMSTKELDSIAEDMILSMSAKPLFKGVQGIKMPFPATICASLNEVVVHGIPCEEQLQNGDILSIDIGLSYDGWCADCARTYAIGTINKEQEKVIKITKETLELAISLVEIGKSWMDIAKELQKFAHKNKCSVVEGLVGHGIGEDLWEYPAVPNYPTTEMPNFILQKNMTIAIEPMLMAGKKDTIRLDDGWAIASKDKSPTAHFEHTIVVTENGAEILTII